MIQADITRFKKLRQGCLEASGEEKDIILRLREVMTLREIAASLGVSYQWVHYVVVNYRQRGNNG